MALTITFDEYNGAGEVKSDSITAIVFGSTDASDFTPGDFSITAGNNSYGKYIKADFADFVGEAVSVVSLAKLHDATGTRATGEAVTLEGLGPVTYAAPSQVDLADTIIPVATPAGQNLALGGSDSGTLVADGQSDYARFQRTTTGSTPNGALADLTITLTYTVA